jgi:hypothetical protein
MRGALRVGASWMGALIGVERVIHGVTGGGIRQVLHGAALLFVVAVLGQWTLRRSDHPRGGPA